MKKKRKPLTLEVRQSIWVMKSRDVGIREIGRRLKIDASIVSRELKRNSLPVYIAARNTFGTPTFSFYNSPQESMLFLKTIRDSGNFQMQISD